MAVSASLSKPKHSVQVSRLHEAKHLHGPTPASLGYVSLDGDRRTSGQCCRRRAKQNTTVMRVGSGGGCAGGSSPVEKSKGACFVECWQPRATCRFPEKFHHLLRKRQVSSVDAPATKLHLRVEQKSASHQLTPPHSSHLLLFLVCGSPTWIQCSDQI